MQENLQTQREHSGFGISFSLYVPNLYSLLYSYKIYHLKRKTYPIIENGLDFFLYIYRITEMLLYYQTLLKGGEAYFYLIPVFPMF